MENFKFGTVQGRVYCLLNDEDVSKMDCLELVKKIYSLYSVEITQTGALRVPEILYLVGKRCYYQEYILPGGPGDILQVS